MRAPDSRGQTTTEYLMVTGFITMVATMVIRVMQEPYQQFLQDLLDWLLNG